MKRDEITEVLTSILKESFELESEEIQPGTNLFEDLGLDSIDAVDLFVQIRDVTGRRPDPAVAREVRTLADLVAFVEKEIALKAAGVPDSGDPEDLDGQGDG